MATPAQIIEVIDHIRRFKPDWRGTLSDSDYSTLSQAYERAKVHPDEPRLLDDKYLGALRQDNPTLFDGTKLVDPAAAQPVTQAAGTHPTAPPAQQHGAPAPAPPASDDGFSGKAAEASKTVDDSLAKNKTALAEADEELVDAVLGAKTGSEQSKAQLQALQSSLIDEIHKLAPSLDTPAGQRQLTDFLESKAQEIRGIANSSAMDATSKSEVLDALVQHYDAVKNSSTSGQPADNAPGANTQPGPGATGSPGEPGGGGSGDPGTTDPALAGLASDPLMGGLGALAGPAMGALSGLPGMMGSMLPGGGGGMGGGLPLGDLGGLIGGAVRDATNAKPEDPAAALSEDPATKAGEDPKSPETAPGEQPADPTPKTSEPAAAQPGGDPQAQPAPAEAGQVHPPAQPAGNVAVELPDGSTARDINPQLARMGKLVLEGASLDDAASQAQVNLLPAGSPVTEPVSPGQLRFGDYAQFTDHRVMALGGGKLWSGGQVVAVDEMPTGPNFLAWARPQVQPAPAASAPVVAASAN